MASAPQLKTAADVDYGADEAAMEAYRAEGTKRALAMDNRGPLRLDDNGLAFRCCADKAGLGLAFSANAFCFRLALF